MRVPPRLGDTLNFESSMDHVIKRPNLIKVASTMKVSPTGELLKILLNEQPVNWFSFINVLFTKLTVSVWTVDVHLEMATNNKQNYLQYFIESDISCR